MAFPASRPASGALTAQILTAYETFQPKVRDIASTETILLGLAQQMGLVDEGDFNHHEIEGIIDEIDSEVKSFKRYDTLSTHATKGAVAAYWDFANYATPISIAWEEEQEYGGPMKLIDNSETRFYKAGRGIGQRLETDMFYGNVADGNNITGMEQALPAVAGSSVATVATFLAAKRWQFRQTTSTYAGVARTAFTSATAGGTGWEGLSAIVTNTGIGATLSIGIANGTPSDGLKVMTHFYYACRRGGNEPNLLISDALPWEQYEYAAMGQIRFLPENVAANEFKLTFANRMFKSAVWAYTDKALASGLTGSATAGMGMIYFLNTTSWKLKIKAGANMALSDFVRPQNQMAVVAQMLWRGQWCCEEPGLNGVLAGFGSSA